MQSAVSQSMGMWGVNYYFDLKHNVRYLAIKKIKKRSDKPEKKNTMLSDSKIK